MTKPVNLSTKIFLDSGDPQETKRALDTLGFLDGQTTNPTLVSKNPHITELKENGALTEETIWNEYRNVASEIHAVIPEGSISVEVYADDQTDYESMLEKGRELSRWFDGIFVKLPVTSVGLRVAETLVKEGVNINMTLCFSQEQAAAVHAATRGARRGQVYVSPFIGRLDDTGVRGLDLVENIVRMYGEWGSHVLVLGASIRNLEHLFGCFERKVDIVTVPIAMIEAWKAHGIENPLGEQAPSILTSIPFVVLEEKDFTAYDINHPLTDAGIGKFSSDWKNLFSK